MLISVSKTEHGYLISAKGWDDITEPDKQKAIELLKFMATNIIRQADDEFEKDEFEENRLEESNAKLLEAEMGKSMGTASS